MADRTYFVIFLIGCLILILGIIITIIFLLTESREIEPEKDDWNQYDSYIFSIFWPPSSCFNKRAENKSCFNRVRELKDDNNFIIHGLWPTYISGKFTEICNKNEDINITFDDENREKFSVLWPGLYSSEQTMWNHEYNKHGYCFVKRIGKNPEKDYKIYFDNVREIFNGYQLLMEEILPHMSKGLHNVTKKKFQNIILDSSQHYDPSTYSLICVRNETQKIDVLEEIRFNYDLNFTMINNIKSSENCPDRFQIYFSNETRRSIYQAYNYYVLDFIWNPSICKGIGKECYRELKKKELNIFMINGLYPSFKSGQKPQWCNIDEDIPIKIDNFPEDLKYNMTNYWIGVKESNNDFWTYVYNRHGYCYIQKIRQLVTNYQPYFQLGVDLYYKYNVKDFLKEIFPKLLPGERKLNKTYIKEQLNEKYKLGTNALTCIQYGDKYYLNEIKLKLDVVFDLTIEGKLQDDCPEVIYADILDAEGPQKQAEGFYETYNMYFFTILWLGSTCLYNGEQCYENIEGVPKNRLTMHGLWPNYKNGTIADWCNGKNDIEIEIKDNDLSTFMNTYYVLGNHTNEYFWGHEYNKHGFCYNQRNNYDVYNYELYFKKIKEIYFKYNFDNIFIDMYKDRIKPGEMEINRNELENYLEGRNIPKYTYVIVCTNITDPNITQVNPHLSEIRIRFDLDFELLKNETDVSEFDCPEIFYANFL